MIPPLTINLRKLRSVPRSQDSPALRAVAGARAPDKAIGWSRPAGGILATWCRESTSPTIPSYRGACSPTSTPSFAASVRTSPSCRSTPNPDDHRWDAPPKVVRASLLAGGNRLRTFGTAEDAGVLAGLRVWIAPIPAVPVCEIGPLESTPLNHSWPVSIRQRPQARDVWPTSRLPHFAVGSPGDVPPRCAARKARVFASASLAAGSLYSSQLPR